MIAFKNMNDTMDATLNPMWNMQATGLRAVAKTPVMPSIDD